MPADLQVPDGQEFTLTVEPVECSICRKMHPVAVRVRYHKSARWSDNDTVEVLSVDLIPRSPGDQVERYAD